MKHCYITFRSITHAQRGERILQKEGIRTRLQRTPKWMEQRGCGYCLRLDCLRIRQALQALENQQIPIGKVYRPDENGNLEEWKP